MKTADEAMRDAAKAGELTYVSIIPRAGVGGIVYWAAYRGASEGFVGMAEDADPGAAIAKAIADAKNKPKLARSAPAKTRKAKPVEEPDFG